MSFCDRFNKLLEFSGVTNVQFSELTGIDRTYIAHFKSGRRKPKQNSPVVYKIAEGIYRCCEVKNKLERLEALTGLAGEEPYEYLIRWMFSDSGDDAGEKVSEEDDISEKNADQFSFGRRFDIAMKLAGISNISLSRQINVDASLISRYRSGGRTPRSNSEIVLKIGSTLWQHIRRNGQVSGLVEYTGTVINDEKQFMNWLFENESYRRSGINAATKLLKMIDSYSISENDIKIPSVELLRFPKKNPSKKIYRGFKGLRDTVIRFLLSVIDSDAERICLYSDQNMDWMFSDPSFIAKWAALMSGCVRKGVHIRIIHNIDRNPEEMVEAISMWLPLYMSGMIEPYFCKKPKDMRFSHSLFLCPGLFCVEASHVTGTEANGIYYFREDKDHLELDAVAFEKLMENAQQLVSFSPATGDDSDTKKYDYDEFKNIRFCIEDESVIIEHLENPALIFTFTHPTMVRAFKDYASYRGQNE